MKTMEETANKSAAKGFAKILAVAIILGVAAFGDVMYILEMRKVFTGDPALLIFCYLGAFTSFAAVGYLLLGKSVVFAPGAQMIMAWIAFIAEIIIVALNTMLIFAGHTGFMSVWAFLSPASPVMHMVLVALLFFLDPELKEKHRDMELRSKMRQLEREHQFAMMEARMSVKKRHLEYTIRELESAVNSDESQARISQHATSMNDGLLTELSGKSLPKEERTGDIYNARGYGRR